MRTTRGILPPRIVVGVDGSDGSKLALRWAQRLAENLGAHIEAVTAWQYPPTFGWPVPTGTWTPKSDADKTLESVINEVFGAQRPAGLRLTVAEGYAAHVLIRASSQAMMLVVGSRGLGGFTGLLLGSVSSNVVHHAQCPVLVVHPELAAVSP